jgi:hypothetical protein
MRVHVGEREASESLFANGRPPTYPRCRGHEHGQTLSDADGNGVLANSSAAGESGARAKVPASTGPDAESAAETGFSDESPPSDLSMRVSELQALMHEAASRDLTPDELDAIAVLTDSLRRLLGEDLNML